MSYYLAKCFSWICCQMPWSWCVCLGNLLGNFSWNFIPKWRKAMAKGNVMRCLKVDEKEAERIAKASWVQFGSMLFEVLRFPKTHQKFHEFVEIEGEEILREGMKLNRGGVIASAHSDNWELMGGALAMAGFPLVGVAKQQHQKGFDKFINDYRTMVGMHITDKENVREMFDMLKKNWFIGLLMDQDPPRNGGVLLTWFGRITNFFHGAATMARYRNAPLYVSFITRVDDRHHKIIVNPPIFVDRTKNKEEDIQKAMEKVAAILEDHVRQHPEEWFWMHNRWASVEDLEK